MYTTKEKIVDRRRLVEDVKEARRNGISIILANGCFDLFHVGHIRYIEGAKALDGFLVVGINSDRQVQKLKGTGRPYMPDNERAEIVAALQAVDRVTIFDEPTVDELLKAICPDIHAKGTDYTTDSVPEREIVASLGGRVAIVGDPKDHSSTDLIASVKKRGEVQ